MPGHNHGPSIKKPRTYEALKRKGMSKSKAAAISNAQAAGTIDRPKKRAKKRTVKKKR